MAAVGVVRLASRVSWLMSTVASAEETPRLWVFPTDGSGEQAAAVVDGIADRGHLVEASLMVRKKPHDAIAATGLGLKSARTVGRVAGCEALLEVQGEQQRVHGCQSRWTMERALTDQYWNPGAESNATLVDLVAGTFGFTVDDSPRYRMRGWRMLGRPGLPCPVCNEEVELASATLQARDGSWYDLPTALCVACKASWLPAKMPADFREAVYAWTDWVLAATDAQAHPTAERRCYVGGLVDPSGHMLDAATEWIYIGETGKDVETRWQEHLNAYKPGRASRRFGGDLRRDLMQGFPVHLSNLESRAYEVFLGKRFALLGYGVTGAH